MRARPPGQRHRQRPSGGPFRRCAPSARVRRGGSRYVTGRMQRGSGDQFKNISYRRAPIRAAISVSGVY